MYGPLPDPNQVLASPNPGATLGCVLLGATLVAIGALGRRLPPSVRVLLAIVGQVAALTAPLALLMDDVVYGAWPNLDKAGSFLFYQDGVHRRLFQDLGGATADPALKLIGAHVGHLWVTEGFDLFLGPHGAFNAQALLSLVAAWFFAFLLFKEWGAGNRASLVLAFPFAMGLHVFRDLQWSTIEKAGVFGLPLYVWTLEKARRRGSWWIPSAGLAFALLAFYNEYLALVNGVLAMAILAGNPTRKTLAAIVASVMACLPLVFLQLQLFHDAGAMADPERFLWERAALDVLNLWPPAWDRLEAWRAFNGAGLALGAWGLWRYRGERRVKALGAVALLLLLLSLGPMLWGVRDHGVPNPVFHAAWTFLPGFWRIAKPEFFLEGTWLVILGLGARTLHEIDPIGRRTWFLHGAILSIWLLSVRTHPAFPVLCEPVEVSLSPAWQSEVFGN